MKKFEFSKLILGSVMALFFAGAIFGAIEVEREHASADSLFAYIGAPTATAFGFYAWKARAENMIKLSKTVEQDKKMSTGMKKRLINAIAKVFSDAETEDYNDRNE